MYSAHFRHSVTLRRFNIQYFPAGFMWGLLLNFETSDLILHGGNEGDCLHAPCSLPWCPRNAPVQIYKSLIGCRFPGRYCLGALALSKTKHTHLRPTCTPLTSYNVTMSSFTRCCGANCSQSSQEHRGEPLTFTKALGYFTCVTQHTGPTSYVRIQLS